MSPARAIEDPQSRTVKVAVVADWSHCERGMFWGELLERVRDAFHMNIELSVFPLADLCLPERSGSGTNHSEHSAETTDSVQDVPGALIHHLYQCHVLIINWDAINGDPEFGANFALSWFEHHAPQVLFWVRERGGILIIEGQAALSVPTQRAYDAVLGKGEVAVTGPPPSGNPLMQRVGKRCVATRHVQRSNLLDWLQELKPNPEFAKTPDQMFPLHAKLRLSQDFLGGADFNVMYRGWFRRRLRTKSRLPWVVLYRTRSIFRYPTMLLARLGSGAIFVTTMYLASNGQFQLVNAMLQASGRANDLPVPNDRLRRAWKRAMASLVPLTAALLTAVIAPGNLARRELLRWLAAFGVLIAGELLRLSVHGLRKLGRAVMGS